MLTSLLVIDDSENTRKEIVRILREADLFDHYREADDGFAGYKAIIVAKPTLIICDLEMPGMDGFKFLALLKSRPDLQDIPIIILTVKESHDAKIKGFEEGAHDYVTKPFNAAELVARVKVHLKLNRLRAELRRTNERLQESSNTDYLTGLHNRRNLMQTLDKELKRAMRCDMHLSVIMLDIDHFKKVNDTFGHQNGDVVLTSIARTIQMEMRSYDIAARYGGEEFVIILPDTPLPGAMIVSERLRADVQSISFAAPMQNLTITVSLGIATYPSDFTDCTNSLLQQADEALYRAKRNGRNKVETMEFFTYAAAD
jgi:diguanylate cyclase (GGDEF)-like protein